MRNTRVFSALLLGFAVALALASCQRRTVTVTSPEGSVTIQKGRGGEVTVKTPDTEVRSTEEDGKVTATVTDKEGTATITQDATGFEMETKEGAIRSAQTVPQEIIDALTVPVYEGAKPDTYLDMPGGRSVSFTSGDDFSTVQNWYKEKLTDWQSITMGSGEGQVAMFSSPDGKHTVSVSSDSRIAPETRIVIVTES